MARIGDWLRALFGRDGGAAEAAATTVASPAVAGEGGPAPTSPSGTLEEARALIETDTRSRGAADLFGVGWKTDAGQVRDHNEDAVYVFTGCMAAPGDALAFGVFMVADGMGGHVGGEEASALALRTAASELINGIYVPLLARSDRDFGQPVIGEVVRRAVQAANAAVLAQLPGSGCTLTAGVVVGSRLFIGHVGDSRAYILRDDEPLRRLTADHTFVHRLVAVGQLSESEAAEHPHRNVLYRAIGQPEALDVDVTSLLLTEGDCLFVCSDGLWNEVDDAEIETALRAQSSPQAVCDELVEAANAAGGEDNISVLLVRTSVE